MWLSIGNISKENVTSEDSTSVQTTDDATAMNVEEDSTPIVFSELPPDHLSTDGMCCVVQNVTVKL